ncbi:probable serine/threonine-protein kinase nek3 [Calliphora vicina]|uniref:probable serine/threonine-protein kinase nek3 n=1 Tax=Calliphora vicina TaxID=7373 RepID=UPI00325A4AF2
MKEIDTETSVIWPSWCYSDNIRRNVLKECAEIEKDLYVNIDKESNYSILGKTAATHEVTSDSQGINSTGDCNKKRCRSKTSSPLAPLAPLSLASTTIVGENKMLSERSLILSGYSNNNTIDSVKTNCEKSNTPPLSAVPSPVQGTGLTITPTTTAAAAAAYLYLEKVKNERMSPRVTAAQLDSLKDAIMESSAAAAVAAAMVNNNNSNSINNNNNNHNSNNSTHNNSSSASNCSNSSSSINHNLVNCQVQQQITSNTSDELQTHSLTQSCSQPQQHHQLQKQSLQHHHQSLHMNSNHVKKERLSPGTNGDLQTTLSRSRSTTPSSFRGTSPQQSVHSSPSETLVPMHNLSTNLLNSIHQAAASSRHGNLSVSSTGLTSANSGLPADFSTRNYSDFMRSLAAKYNNTNPNDNLKRNTLFEATSNNTISQKKTSTAAAQKTSYATSPTTQINKEVSITTTSSLPPPPPLTAAAISPGESALKLTQQNKLAAAVANAAAACSSNVSPYMTSFLSSLPFSPGIFPPLIDMSSTQALITLARAAKENEIHNMLSASAQHPKRSAASTSPSPSPSLNMALQQAAQFISPALIYSAQLQKQQLQQQQHQQQQQQQQASRQSSPRLPNISNSTTSNSTTSAKSNRNLGEKINVSPLDLSSQPPAAKRFKAESTSSQSSNDGLIHTTITRRASSSTATTSPSPPPLNEKSLNAFTASPAATASAVVGSSTKTEATTTAFTPIKVASSTSATSSIAPAVNVRQCQAQSEELNSWTVDDVCAFVGSIDICAEYVKHFRDQCIDGSGLPLLTEDHLVNSLGMKLGPALKLRSVLAKKLGGPCPCVSCVAQVQQVLALQTGGMTAAAATIATTTTASDHTTGSIATNVAAIGCSSNSGGSCNSHLPKNPLSTNSSKNCSSYNSSNSNSSSVNKNESTTSTTSSTNTISANSTTTNVYNSDGNTPRGNSNCNANVGHFSSPPPPQAPIPQQQQQHHLHPQEQHSPSQNICSSNNSNPTTNRHDNADSSS